MVITILVSVALRNLDLLIGTIGKPEFREVMKQMGVSDQFLQDLIFNVFDTNKDGSINFQEFVLALSVMTRGEPNEKLECMKYHLIFQLIFCSCIPHV